ncbi:hypothetical protein E0K89_019075 [Aquicoccus sp. SCR17]|nr:hypothetical protein [Carideicomes alvinocaridis]
MTCQGGGVLSLFKDRRASFSYNTRVGIRAIPSILGLSQGDEVLGPAYNCGSEIDPLIHAGLKVNLFPVGRDMVIDPNDIEKRITSRTKAIYVIHFFGELQPHLYDIRKISDRHGIKLIEDCALSLLSGSFPADGRVGDISLFCFYKFFPVVGGGALVINDGNLPDPPTFSRSPPFGATGRHLVRKYMTKILGDGPIRKIRKRKALVRNTKPSQGEFQDMPEHYYFDTDLEGRGMSKLTGRALEAVDVKETFRRRRANWFAYRELLDGVSGVKLLKSDLAPETCPVSMPIIVRNRDHIARMLQADGFEATPWWGGFNRRVEWSGQTDAIWLKSHVLSLPLDQSMEELDIRNMVNKLCEVVV